MTIDIGIPLKSSFVKDFMTGPVYDLRAMNPLCKKSILNFITVYFSPLTKHIDSFKLLFLFFVTIIFFCV